MRSLLLVIFAVGCGEVSKLQVDAKTPACGDGVVDVGEDCDTGGESASCNDDCTIARCGDMKVNAAAGEQCEDGNADDGDACTNACQFNAPFASTGAEGPFAPTEDVTITGGVHHYTTINIPAGVTVMVETGVAELRATGAVVIDGTINVSGGNGGEGGNSPSGACDRGGGGGGPGGIPIDGAPGTNVDCPAVALGGFGAAGASGNNSRCATGGTYGGGGGIGTCSGGGGGGGFAGGGGGAGFNQSHGGAGATAFGGVGGAGGVANTNQDSSGKTPGRGGAGTGNYAGRDGVFFPSCNTTVWVGTSGGGGAIGALAQSDLAVSSTFQPGSGGGGGGSQCSVCFHGAGGGGGGGGAIRVASPVSITVSATGKVLANGGNGGAGSSTTSGNGGGGGGSGGVIYLAAPSVVIQSGATISAAAGAGGNAFPTNCGRGGAGGVGRIRISATQSMCTLDGLFSPALAAVGCAPASVAERVFVAPYPN